MCTCVVPKVRHVLSTLADLLFPMELIKVLTALEPVVEEWYTLGLHLGLSDSVMRTIEKDYPAIAQRKINMVQRWMSAPQLCPSWCSLVKALHEVGLNTAAERISKKYSKCSVHDILTLPVDVVCTCVPKLPVVTAPCNFKAKENTYERKRNCPNTPQRT